MSGEAAKERVTPIPSKSGLLTYIRFGEAQCASCGLSSTQINISGQFDTPLLAGKARVSL